MNEELDKKVEQVYDIYYKEKGDFSWKKDNLYSGCSLGEVFDHMKMVGAEKGLSTGTLLS